MKRAAGLGVSRKFNDPLLDVILRKLGARGRSKIKLSAQGIASRAGVGDVPRLLRRKIYAACTRNVTEKRKWKYTVRAAQHA